MKAKAKQQLRALVKRCGSQEKAAAFIGVAFKTVNEWLNDKSQPHGLSIQRLHDLKIEV